MSLPADWQERLVRVLHGSEPPDASFFTGGPWHDPLGQIGVYQEQYYLRLVDSVAEEVKGWVALYGEDPDAMIRRYLYDCPSRHWTLNLIADRFADWLLTQDRPLAEVEIARLDRAVNLGFCAAPGTTPDPAQLATMPALRLQPAVTLLRNTTNVHLIRSAALREVEAPELIEGDYPITIFRRGTKMRHMELHPVAFRMLECIDQRMGVGEALEVVVSEGASPELLAQKLGAWFRDFAERELVEIVP